MTTADSHSYVTPPTRPAGATGFTDCETLPALIIQLTGNRKPYGLDEWQLTDIVLDWLRARPDMLHDLIAQTEQRTVR